MSFRSIVQLTVAGLTYECKFQLVKLFFFFSLKGVRPPSLRCPPSLFSKNTLNKQKAPSTLPNHPLTSLATPELHPYPQPSPPYSLSPLPPLLPSHAPPHRQLMRKTSTPRPLLKRARSWDGLMPEAPSGATDPSAAAAAGEVTHGSRMGIINNLHHHRHHGYSSGSVSESSGSIVGGRMFERSAPAAPGAGLDRAWLAGQAAQHALARGKGGIEAGLDDGGDGDRECGGWRRGGYRAADHMKMLDNIARGIYSFEARFVGEEGQAFISQVRVLDCKRAVVWV